MDFSNTILEQLGGNKFVLMTGTKNFVKDSEKRTLRMKLSRNAVKAQYLTIKLTAMDDYNLEFTSYNKNLEKKIIKEYEGIYVDQLQEIFTEVTGLYTSL
jgi:hypothetical protein